MKFKRILAAVLSVLMLSSVMVFTASADTTPVYVMKAHNGSGFSGEAVTGTKTYDAENDIVYYHYVPYDKNDWMHFGWHNAANQFAWSAPMTIGMIMRTNKENAVPKIRLCDRDPSKISDIEKNSDAIKGNGTWEVVWFPTITQTDLDNVAKDDLKFDGLTHVQCFAMGGNLFGNQNLDSGLYFDIAGYVFFNDTLENLADVDLYDVIDVGAPDVTISFDAQNGSAVTSYTAPCGTYVAGKVTFPDAAAFEVPEGKVFAGWATDAAGENKVDAENAAVPAADTTYYAVWAQDESKPGDVTLKELRVNGTLSKIFGLEDLSAETLTLNVPYNWSGDKVPALTVVSTDAAAQVTVTEGTFGEGSTIRVKNGSSDVTYSIVYNNAEASSKSFTPSGVVTSNPTGYKVPYKNSEYTVSKTTYISSARSQTNAEIQGNKGIKISYNTKQEVVIPSASQVNDEAKTITGTASFFTFANDSTPSFEGGGAYGFITLSDYPWARVKYFVDAGEDGKTVERPFIIASTSWNNSAKDKGYAESVKKNTAVASEENMVEGRWAYAYINLGKAFSEDYGYTYQLHFRPFADSNKSKNVVKASADDATVAVPVDAGAGKFPELFDDAFYLGSVEIFNKFPGTEDGKYEQIAPYAGLFEVTDETEIDANDGTISGLAEGMEYKIKDAEEWIAYAEPALQGEVTLAPGTYEIRYAAYGNYAASPAVEVTINSALSAKPEVEAVNATAVGANDGKITGVDAAMSYRAKGAEEWTAVAEGVTEITNLKPGAYEFVYLADGELRLEDSEITEIAVVVDFDTEIVFYVTNNEANKDTAVFDGSSYEKAYYVGKGTDVHAVIRKHVAANKTATMVVIDGIYLGSWCENGSGGDHASLTITGLTPECYIDFCCHNTAAGNNFAMQNFCNLANLTIDNITLQKTCLTGEGLAGECGFCISSMTNFTIGENVISGVNSEKIRVYNNSNGVLKTVYTIKGGKLESAFAGPTYSNPAVSQGTAEIIIDGADVGMIAASRHQRAWLGDFNVIVNSGNVRGELYAGSYPGAFGGDAYVEINGGAVKKLYTTSLGREDVWNSNGNKYYTGKGIAAGSSVVIVNGGKIEAFAKGVDAPGGSALIVGEGAEVPELTGTEADYVISISDTSLIETVVEENDYNYESYERVIKSGETEITETKQADIAFKADTITGFKVTLPEGYNAVKLNGEIVELTDGVLALDALADGVNEITFAATWILKADLNGGNAGYDIEGDDGIIKAIFADGAAVDSDEYESLPNADDVIKPYRAGYRLAGWALTAEATAEECVEFPYAMAGDTIFYAIWEEANDTPFVVDDETYVVYTTEAEAMYDGFVPSIREDLGEFDFLGAYGVKAIDVATGEENTDAGTIPVTFDASGIDLEGKLLYVENAEFGGIIGMDNLGNGKYTLDIASGIYQVYTLDPIALYTLEGTYYSKREEYIVDIYLDSAAVNAGSVGLGYNFMTYNGITAGENVQIIESTDAETAEENGFILITWGVDSVASIGGNGKVHIATLNFSMNEENREWFEMFSYAIGAAEMEEVAEIYDGEYYLVAEHKANELSVSYVPAIIADVTDTVGPDDMVTVKGTVEMTAREDGTAPIDGNYAVLYWRHKGMNAYNSVVIEDADTDTAVVEYVLEDVPADVEIEIYVEKNGYLTEKAVFVFDAATEEETEEKPEREADALVLVPGDIKGDFADFCGDGKINIADFVRVLRGFDEDATDEYKLVVDINEDGDVNVTDLGFVKANFGAVAE